MAGIHARPSGGFLRPAPDTDTRTAPSTLTDTAPAAEAGPRRSRHRRHHKFGSRLRRRILAYRDIEFLSTHLPGDEGLEEDCLLLVHVRKVVGQVHYRICTECAEGVITGVDIDAHLHSTGIGTRAVSHLRSRHPGISWRSTLTMRTTRDLMRRMRVPHAPQGDFLCVHMPGAAR